MIIISNSTIPDKALNKLAELGGVISFITNGITYPAISGHPDVFFCQIDKLLVAAPNIPADIKNKLVKRKINFIEGSSAVGSKYPETAKYNAVVTDSYLIHNLKVTDSRIKELCSNRISIHVNQAYTRCNLLPLNNDRFITSDLGIYETLINNKLIALYVDPKQIKLPYFKNGFFGGACGVYKNKIYIIGSLIEMKGKNQIIDFLSDTNYNIVELYNGPIYDGGSLIFIDSTAKNC
ncbi:MAG: hypothetical protein HQ521_18620 [Bacteroidetes bacterium]|nr:hypothetical protein [Bacteroidota bacterium]